jgi:hypothetical protein
VFDALLEIYWRSMGNANWALDTRVVDPNGKSVRGGRGILIPSIVRDIFIFETGCVIGDQKGAQ